MAHRLTLLTLLTLSGSLVALSSPHETYSASLARARPKAGGSNPGVLVNISKLPKTVEVNITAAVTSLSMQPGVTTEAFAYNGQVPGPTLDVSTSPDRMAALGDTVPAPSLQPAEG